MLKKIKDVEEISCLRENLPYMIVDDKIVYGENKTAKITHWNYDDLFESIVEI